MNTGSRDTNRFLLSGGSVIAKSQSDLATKSVGEAKLMNICANYRENGDCTVAINTRNDAEKTNLVFNLANISLTQASTFCPSAIEKLSIDFNTCAAFFLRDHCNRKTQ